jgi:hypothetical protein
MYVSFQTTELQNATSICKSCETKSARLNQACAAYAKMKTFAWSAHPHLKRGDVPVDVEIGGQALLTLSL